MSIVAFAMLHAVSMPAMIAANGHIRLFLTAVRISPSSMRQPASSVRLSVFFRLNRVMFLKPFISPSSHFLSLIAVTFLYSAFELVVIAFNNEQLIVG